MSGGVRIILCIAMIVCVAAGALWVGDYAVFRYRVWRNQSPYSSVTVYQYYTIQEKNNRIEYIYKATVQQSCANALFPHIGLPPCWYARKHTEKAIPV